MGERAQWLADYAAGHAVLTGALVVTGLMAVLVARKLVRKVTRHEQPDVPLSNLAMLLGLGWSSEAVWVLTGPDHADLPTGLRIAIFAVLESILIVSMIRTARSVRTTAGPGRAGRAVWTVASGMSVVGMLAAGGLAEAFLRGIIPLLLTLMWWQGVVPEGARRVTGAVSWRWTPRRLLLAVGAIEPGERDVETVHRERTIQQLTRLEFRRQGAKGDRQRRLGARLASRSLLIDDDMIAEIRRRVRRATWFSGDLSDAARIEQVRQAGTRAWQQYESGLRATAVTQESTAKYSSTWPESVKSADDVIRQWAQERAAGFAAPGSPVVIPGYEREERSEEKGSAAPKRRATPEALHSAALELMIGNPRSNVEGIAHQYGVGVSTLRRYEKVRRLLVEHGSERSIDYTEEKVRPDVVEAMRSYLRNEQAGDSSRGDERHEAGE